MKWTLKNTTLKLVTLLMIGVMGVFIANKAVFLHVHILNDGRIIEHAHPYDTSSDSEPYKSHQHTKAELLFFQNLELLFTVVFLILVLIAFVEKTKFSFSPPTKHTLGCLILHKGRAPPIQ